MISREPTLERLAIARSLLLEPFGLDESALARALRTIGEHRIERAPFYRSSFSWSFYPSRTTHA